MSPNLVCDAHSFNSKEKGVALIISLIILVIMTILGMSAIRLVTSEERMATNTYDRGLAFQATESTLKSIEELIEAEKPTPTSGCAVAGSIMACSAPAASSTPRWLDSGFTSWQNGTTIGTGTTAITPKYFVEYLGDTFACRPGDSGDPNNCKRYRITAQTAGSAGRATVMLQSVYATD
ncbi:PilX N-terminal domain-containing pilus assembly protein [uncultured Rhodoferax sp.]|uniref:pilus assembly PilX family protein n=1 Tax=uncultured Rhodoferax sp. TaxID=223188 RepID=UPI0025DA3FB8|nr:PilX N-terminal domain-containing pilus assembly protein [uncultured Rhodoferax sp.]